MKPHPDIVNYVEKHLEKGFKIHQIRKKLLEVGHPIEAVELAINAVEDKKIKKSDSFKMHYGIVIALVAIVFLGFIIYVGYQYFSYRTTVDDIEQSMVFEGMKDIELIKHAASTGDLRSCAFISEHNTYYACYDKIWETDECQYYKLITQFKGNCILLKEYSTELLEKYCSSIEGYTACRTAIVINENNPELCNDDATCLYNYWKNTGDPKNCLNLESGASDRCVYELAEENNNSQFCDFSDEEYCKFNFMNTQEKTKYYNNKFLEDPEYTHNFFYYLYDAYEDLGVENCGSLTGMYSGKLISDYCYFFHVQKGTIDQMYLYEDVLGGYKDVCTKITNQQLNSCCMRAADQKIINDDCKILFPEEYYVSQD